MCAHTVFTATQRFALPNARFLLQKTGLDDPFQGQAVDIGLKVSDNIADNKVCSAKILASRIGHVHSRKELTRRYSKILRKQNDPTAETPNLDTDPTLTLTPTLVVTHVQRMAKALAQMTGNTYDKVAMDLERDFYLSAFEAREYGLIDKVGGLL